MTERTSADRDVEVQLNNSFWKDFSNARKAIKALPGWETVSIFSEIGRDQQVIQAFQKVREFLSRSPEQHALYGYEMSLAGFLFEEYASGLVRKRIGMIGINGVVLSPNQTFEIYKIAHPEYTVNRSHNNLRMTLCGDVSDGIRIPDGIVIERNQGNSEIRAICEYALGPSDKEKRAQRDRFSSGQAVDDILVGGFLQEQIVEYLATLDPGLSKNLSRSDHFLFIFIRPEKEPAEGFRISDGTCRIFVPFTREKFRDVIGGLIQDIQTSLSQQDK